MKQLFIKRCFDLAFCLLAISALTPILILLCVSILVTTGRPILFTQSRSGLNGAPFRIYKFRTMTNSSNSNFCAASDTARITKIGNVMRNTGLDELPSLINILKGEMSVVGPRPLISEYLNLYNKHQLKRFDVRPGLTGWAQVNGRNAISWEEKFEYDIWYVSNHTIILDMTIIIKTAIIFFRSFIKTSNETEVIEPFTGTTD